MMLHCIKVFGKTAIAVLAMMLFLPGVKKGICASRSKGCFAK